MVQVITMLVLVEDRYIVTPDVTMLQSVDLHYTQTKHQEVMLRLVLDLWQIITQQELIVKVNKIRELVIEPFIITV